MSSEGSYGNSHGTQKNVAAICAMERAALEERTTGERVGDLIARVAGKIGFVWVHILWFGLWIVVNAGLFPGIRPFDPYPYQFLTFVVSLEAIFLSLFIMMSQNRATRQADARAHLDLQINLLAEQESTRTLQLLERLCSHFHVVTAPDKSHLSEPVEPEQLVRELKEGLPG